MIKTLRTAGHLYMLKKKCMYTVCIWKFLVYDLIIILMHVHCIFLSILLCRIALMQFATSDQIFLLDMITLHSLLHKSDWFLLANALFCNEEMIKLGQQMN